jgi:hypothetical protein
MGIAERTFDQTLDTEWKFGLVACRPMFYHPGFTSENSGKRAETVQ